MLESTILQEHAQKAMVEAADSDTKLQKLARTAVEVVNIGDSNGHEIVLPLDSYARLYKRVDRLWHELMAVVLPGYLRDDYYSTKRQYERLEQLRSHAFRENDSVVWGLLLIKVLYEPPDPVKELSPVVPTVNRLAYAMGFFPDLGIPFDFANKSLGLDLLQERIGVDPVVPPRIETHARAQDTVGGFIHFYLSRLGDLPRVSKRRQLELIEMEETGILALQMFHSLGEVYRGWLMVGMAFLAPYALAPELVAAGGTVAIEGGLEMAAQAELAAAVIAQQQVATRMMLLFIDVAPPFFDLAITLGKTFLNRPDDKPLTPGETLNLIISALGAIPSAKLGYFMMGFMILTPLDATKEFLKWVEHGIASLTARANAAKAGLELQLYDSLHTLIVDLDE